MTVQFNAPKVTEPVGKFPLTRENQSLILEDAGTYGLKATVPWSYSTDSGSTFTGVVAGVRATITVALGSPVTVVVKMAQTGVEDVEVDFTPGFTVVTPQIPAGGTTGQVLKKTSNADGDTSWGTPAAPALTGRLVIGCPDDAPSDATIGRNTFAPYIEGVSGDLMFRVRLFDGTYGTCRITNTLDG